MTYQTLDSADTVQVFSPTLVADALFVTIRSYPSGSTLVRTVPRTSFDSNQTSPILASLSDAVENILQEGTATAAQGTQGLDDSGLIYDAVTFTVEYVPPDPIPGQITASVEIPVDVVTADTQFGGFLEGGSAADRINATYQRLRDSYTG